MRRAALASLAVLLIAALGVVAHAASVSVSFDKPIYDRDDAVTMSINASTLPLDVAIEVYAPGGSLVWIHQATLTTNPSFFRFKLPGGPDGTYTVYVAAKGSVPQEFRFTVKRPTFVITSLTPSSVTVNTGGLATFEVRVKNTGAAGSFTIRAVDQNGNVVATVGPNLLGYNEEATYYVSFTAPSSSGTYSYTIEVYNTKYGVVDASQTVSVVVKKPVTTTTTPPPPPPVVPVPPAPPTTTTTTTPTPTATVTPPVTVTPKPAPPPAPNVTAVFVASLENVVAPGNVVTKPVTIIVPQARVEIVIPPKTVIMPLKPVSFKPQVEIAILAKPPAAKPTEQPVGPAVDIRVAPVPVKLSKNVTVAVPFDPGKVPPGFQVRLAYFDPEKGAWVPLPTLRVDPVTGKVVGLTDHFTVFAAVAFRVVKPVTTTTTTVTTTKPVTPVTTTTTTTTTATVTSPVTTTTTTTATTTVTVTATPVTMTKTVVVTRTAVSPVTKTVTKEVVKTTATTVTKEVVKTKEVVTTSPVTKIVTQTTTVTTISPASYAVLVIGVITLIAAALLARRSTAAGGAEE